MEDSTWRGQRTSEEREPFGREKITKRVEPNFAADLPAVFF